MPEPQTAANVWFYQDFLADGQKVDFWVNRPEDWSRLQILEGDTLKPAMEPGFQGRPTPAQVEMLYQHALQGKLFFFELGNPTPRMLGQEGNEKRFVDPNAQEPEAPEKPAEGAHSSLMVSYKFRLDDYNERMERYQRNLDDLKALGDGFKNAVDAYNADRDLQREGAERNGRHVNQISVRNQRGREKADRVINDVFGPKPVASPEVFYVPGHPTGETVFKFEHYGEQFAPNAIELPAGSKLSAEDVATINFAMLGAKKPVMDAAQRRLGTSPLQTENMATEGFNMLVTGMFGEPRMNQQLSDHKLIGYVLRKSKDVIEQYNSGYAAPLGKHLGECVRNIKNVFTGSANNDVTQDTVAATKLIERVQDLLQRDPALMQAANLKENEQEFMRGYVQMGKVYDNYLQSFVTLNEAQAHGQVLSTDKKAELLADIVLRAIVENELTKDRENLEKSQEYKALQDQANEKNLLEAEAYDKWREDVMNKMEDKEAAAREQAKYLLQHDYNMHTASVYSRPMDHKVISLLAKNGVVERLRQNLQKDPYILAAAAKEPMDISGKDLFQSDEMKALAEKAWATLHGMEVTGQQKLTWFNNMKALVTAPEGQDLNALSPWLSASVASDAGRLMIAMPNGRGGKSLINLANLLDGGLKDLENPTQQAIDLMYRNALEGNLYYYQVGKELPLRLTAEGVKAEVQQIKQPVKPTLWQQFANLITGGWAYADICNPKPDRDPAAVDGILYSSDGRMATITVEMAEHSNQPSAQVDQARKSYEQRIKDEVNNFSRIPDDSISREFPQYNLDDVASKLNKIAFADTVDMEDNLLAGEMTSGALYIRTRLCAENPTQQQIREAMAAAVLMESVKEERLSGKGDTIRTQLVRNREGMVQSMVNTDAFRAFTEDASMDMLKHFIMVDGARNMYQAMKTIASNRAKQQEKGNDVNALEQNVQKQNENQKIIMG